MNRRSFLMGSAALLGVAATPAARPLIPAIPPSPEAVALLQPWQRLVTGAMLDQIVFGAAVIETRADGSVRLVPFHEWPDVPGLQHKVFKARVVTVTISEPRGVLDDAHERA